MYGVELFLHNPRRNAIFTWITTHTDTRTFKRNTCSKYINTNTTCALFYLEVGGGMKGLFLVSERDEYCHIECNFRKCRLPFARTRVMFFFFNPPHVTCWHTHTHAHMSGMLEVEEGHFSLWRRQIDFPVHGEKFSYEVSLQGTDIASSCYGAG